MRFPKGSYSWVALDYAKRVTSGKIKACLQVRQAAQRFINDLKRTDFIYDKASTDHVCMFAEGLVHVKGQWAGQHIKLEPFQTFILANIFGFLDPKTRLRRFREAFILLPRKNGKSALAAAIALYMTFADGEYGAEGYDPRRDSTNGGSGAHRIADQSTWQFREGSVEIGRRRSHDR